MRRPSPALLLSVAALVIALGGTAVAAKRYVITSTKQISPKVLQQLRGRTGPKGPIGLPGPRGTDGAAGQAGAAGPPGPATIVSATRKGPITVNGTVAELTALPPGSWLVVATLDAYGGLGDMTCQLAAGSFNPPGSTVRVGTAKAQLTTSAAVTLASPANIELTCTPDDVSTQAASIRLYAIRTGDLDSRALD